MSSHLDTIPACDGRTDGRTRDDSKDLASIASRGYNVLCLFESGIIAVVKVYFLGPRNS